MNPQERREYAQLLNDLALDFAERLIAERERHEREMRLLRSTLDRKNFEIRNLKEELEGRD